MIKGFYMAAGRKGYFYKTDSTKRTTAIINAFIETIATANNKPQELIDRAKADKMTQDDFRRRISAATLEKKELPTVIFYTINGKNFIANFPAEDFNNEIVVF